MKTYELQVLRKDKWEIQASFDGRDEALREARSAVYNNRFPAIRVTEEIFDAESNLTRTRSIFSYEYSPPLDMAGREEKFLTGLRDMRLRSRLLRNARPDFRSGQAYSPAVSPLRFVAPVFYLLVILLLGVLSLVGLHTLFVH